MKTLAGARSSAGRGFGESRWVVVPPGALNPLCPHHDGLCCFEQDRTDRCPWCHSTWGVILASDWHTCERPAVWHSGQDPHNKARKAWHVSVAAQMRAEAAQERGESARTPRVTEKTLAVANGGFPTPQSHEEAA